MARNYAQEKRQHKLPRKLADDRKRHAARAKLVKAGLVRKGDGKQVDHKKGIKAGNSRGNLRVMSKRANQKKQPRTKPKGKARFKG